MAPDPAWAGPIQFHELLFGTWSSYIALVLIWEKFLKAPLDEWRYLMLTCLGAAVFVINHYMNYAPFYYTLINSYSVFYLFIWFWLGVRLQTDRSWGWKLGATTLAIPYTVIYILLEQSTRLATGAGLHEMWVLIAGFAGTAAVIFWRGRVLGRGDPTPG